LTVLIIAEAGVNHNGDLAIARQLIDIAAESGADLVKFQTFSAKRLVTPDAQKAAYQNRTTDANETQYAMLERLELSEEMHIELMQHCERRGIGFFSTAFDIESIDLLVRMGIERIKIPSGEITNLPYLRHVAKQNLPVFMSTGMCDMDEVADAVAVLENGGLDRSEITVLHCSTEYPTPIANVNLRAMTTLREQFGVSVGYSDHTLGTEIAIAAAALGASVIEKHFTLDRSLPGPDHEASLGPDELKAMVDAIRNIEQALGDGIKRASTSELATRDVVRKSLVARHAIREGQAFSAENLDVKRPGTGISSMAWDEVLGRRAKRDFAANELIEI